MQLGGVFYQEQKEPLVHKLPREVQQRGQQRQRPSDHVQIIKTHGMYMSQTSNNQLVNNYTEYNCSWLSNSLYLPLVGWWDSPQTTLFLLFKGRLIKHANHWTRLGAVLSKSDQSQNSLVYFRMFRCHGLCRIIPPPRIGIMVGAS